MGASGVLTPRGPWAHNVLKIGGLPSKLPENCMILKNLEGKEARALHNADTIRRIFSIYAGIYHCCTKENQKGCLLNSQGDVSLPSGFLAVLLGHSHEYRILSKLGHLEKIQNALIRPIHTRNEWTFAPNWVDEFHWQFVSSIRDECQFASDVDTPVPAYFDPKRRQIKRELLERTLDKQCKAANVLFFKDDYTFVRTMRMGL